MRALKIIGIILLVLLGLFLIVPAFLPSKIHLERSTIIKAPAAMVFEQVNTLQNWDYWTPFRDSSMIITLAGNPAGVGAIMNWTGIENGSMEITKSEPNTFISTNLKMGQGQSSVSDWKFEETADGIKVSWTLDVVGLGYPMGRFMGLAFPMWMNPVFDQGLDSLRVHCERLAANPTYRTGEISVVDVPERMVLMMSDSLSVEELPAFFERSYGAIMQLIGAAGVEPAGAPFAIYNTWIEGGRNSVAACIPVAAPMTPSAGMQYMVLPATRAVMASHFGPYESVGPTWLAIEKYMEDNSLNKFGSPWEVYANDPTTVEPAAIQTDIYYPFR
jgi:effector-binding domain-containing protein